jgi:hypothetical protein
VFTQVERLFSRPHNTPAPRTGTTALRTHTRHTAQAHTPRFGAHRAAPRHTHTHTTQSSRQSPEHHPTHATEQKEATNTRHRWGPGLLNTSSRDTIGIKSQSSQRAGGALLTCPIATPMLPAHVRRAAAAASVATRAYTHCHDTSSTCATPHGPSRDPSRRRQRGGKPRKQGGTRRRSRAQQISWPSCA